MCPFSSPRECSDNASQSLLDFIIRRPPTERDVRPLAQQLAHTLSLLHAHGVVHRNLKLENIFIGPTTIAFGGRRAILGDFTFAGVTGPDQERPGTPLAARASEQFSPAPELLGMQTTEPSVQIPYAGPPVDVWGLGVVLFALICRRVPFDEPTLDAMHKASLRSPATLRFPKRVSRDGRDLLRCMLQADPIARASLDDVLNHPWMKPAVRCPNFLRVGARVPKCAALRWPDQVNRQMFDRIAALDHRNGDVAWRCLADALELVSHLCEEQSHGDSQTHPLRHAGADSFGSQTGLGLGHCLPSAVALCWIAPPRSRPPRKRQTKA